MKDLLDKIHSIVDTLGIIILSDVYKIYSPKYENDSTPYMFRHIKDIDEEIHKMSMELIEYKSPFYILEAIYLSSGNFTKKFIQTFESKLAKNILFWAVIDDAIAYDCSQYKNSKEFPKYLNKLLSLSETINDLNETIINDFYNFSEIYLEIDSSKFISYPTLKSIFLQHYRYYFEKSSNQNVDKQTILEEYIQSIEEFENISKGNFIIDTEKPVREVLEENPTALFELRYTLPIISEYLFKTDNNKVNSIKIKEIIDFLSSNKMCKLSYRETISLVTNKFNISTEKILWTGKKTDAFRFKDYLEMSVSEFNNNFYFEDNKKLQNNHKSTSGWSELSDFLSKTDTNNLQ